MEAPRSVTRVETHLGSPPEPQGESVNQVPYSCACTRMRSAMKYHAIMSIRSLCGIVVHRFYTDYWKSGQFLYNDSLQRNGQAFLDILFTL